MVLIEMGDRLAQELPSEVSTYAQRDLETRGIEVWLGARVTGYQFGRVRVHDGRELNAGTLIWTANVRPSPLIRAVELPHPERTDHRLPVNEYPSAWVRDAVGRRGLCPGSGSERMLSAARGAACGASGRACGLHPVGVTRGTKAGAPPPLSRGRDARDSGAPPRSGPSLRRRSDWVSCLVCLADLLLVYAPSLGTTLPCGLRLDPRPSIPARHRRAENGTAPNGPGGVDRQVSANTA